MMPCFFSFFFSDQFSPAFVPFGESLALQLWLVIPDWMSNVYPYIAYVYIYIYLKPNKSSGIESNMGCFRVYSIYFQPSPNTQASVPTVWTLWNLNSKKALTIHKKDQICWVHWFLEKGQTCYVEKTCAESKLYNQPTSFVQSKNHGSWTNHPRVVFRKFPAMKHSWGRGLLLLALVMWAKRTDCQWLKLMPLTQLMQMICIFILTWFMMVQYLYNIIIYRDW